MVGLGMTGCYRADESDVPEGPSANPAPPPVSPWAKTYTGSTLYDLDEMPAGGFIVCGESGNPQGSQFPSFLWAARLSGTGDIVWEKGIGPSNNNVRSFGVEPTGDGGCVLIGNIYAVGAGAYDLVVIKMDADGDIQWQKAYGDAGYNGGRAVLQTTDGGFLVADDGFTRIVRLDSGGNIVWERRYAADSWSRFQSDLAATTDGGFAIVGRSGVGDGLILKLNQDGSVSWQKRLLGLPSLQGIRQAGNGDLIIAGTTWGMSDSDAWLGRLDASGNLLWQNRYGLADVNEAGADVRVTADGGLLVTGSIESGSASADFWVFKTDAGGVLQWQKRYSSSADYEDPYDIRLTADGGFVLGGSSSFTNSLIVKCPIDGVIPGFSSATSAGAQSTSFPLISLSEVPSAPTSTVTITSLTIVPRNTVVQQIAP